MVVPGLIHSWIRVSSVFSALSSTVAKKHFLESSSIPPNTHCPSTTWPRWYFLFPILLSSIWTSFPGPPRCSLFSKSHFTKFSAKHVPVDTCMWPEAKFLFDLPLLQSSGPPVRKFDDLFNWQIWSLKPTSRLNTCFHSLSLPANLFTTLPHITVRVINALSPPHAALANITNTTWGYQPFVFQPLQCIVFVPQILVSQFVICQFLSMYVPSVAPFWGWTLDSCLCDPWMSTQPGQQIFSSDSLYTFWASAIKYQFLSFCNSKLSSNDESHSTIYFISFNKAIPN